MKRSRFICILLLLCVTLSFCLASCNKDGDVSVAESSGSATQQDTEYFKDGKYVGDTLGKSYSGRTLTVLTCGVNQTHESEIVKNTYEDGTTATYPDIINKDLADRAEYLKSTLGLDIEEVYVFEAKRPGGGMCDRIRNDALSGSVEYQIVVPCLYDGATLAVESYFHDLNKVEGLQIQAPWWNQEFNSGMTVGGQLYFTIGDIGLGNKNSTAALFFNYDLWYRLGLNETYSGDPYTLVRDKKWTVDLVFEAVKSVGRDLNTDGTIDYKDEFGWGGQLDDMWSLFYASGERIAKNDANGYPAISIFNERSATLMEKMQELVRDKEHYISANDYFGVAQWPTVLVQQGFTEGRALFYNANVGTVIELGNMNDHYGIVPLPLADDTQENYYSLINPWTSTCFAIPAGITGDELEMTAAALNVLGAYSKNTLSVDYQDIVLAYMKTRDNDSIEMINDYIFPTRGCDIGMAYQWGGLDQLLHGMASAEVGTFSSAYEAKASAAKAALDETLAFYRDHEK